MHGGLPAGAYNRAMAMPKDIEESLARLVRAKDRSTPLVFVGRQAELRFLRDVVHAAADGGKGLTAVVQGVPGAGKTSLCEEFGSRVCAASTENAPTVYVDMPVEAFDNTPVDFVKELSDKVASVFGMRNWKWCTDKAANVASARTRTDVGQAIRGLSAASSLDRAMDSYRGHPWPSNLTLIVTVDEAQQLADTPQVRNNLLAMHRKGFGLNFALIAFGLQDTRSRLVRLGLSRLAADNVRTLGLLSSREAATLVDETFKTVGLSLANAEWRDYVRSVGLSEANWTRWQRNVAKTIQDESVDFPHHLANGMRVAADLLVNEGLRREAPLDVLREGCRRHKRNYYQEQLEPFARHTLALGAALSLLDPGTGTVQRAAVLQAVKAADDWGEAVDGARAARVVDAAIAKGLFAKAAQGRIGVVIPSLASYLVHDYHGALAERNPAAQSLDDVLAEYRPKARGA